MSPPLVFMIDDNRHDLELGELAFAEIGVSVAFVGLQDAEIAVDRLRALAADPDATRPKLVLLDLNMPRVLGVEILALMKGDRRLRSIPVVILTTSNANIDRARCLALGADEYQVKPHRLDAYLDLFGSFRRYLGDAGHSGPAQPEAGDAGPASPRTPDPPRMARWRDAPRGHLLVGAVEPVVAALRFLASSMRLPGC